ncbi:MAG: HD domain-containing phosphohydrolase [Planctomycetota bacterium]
MNAATANQLHEAAVLAFAHALVVAAINRQLHDADNRHVQDALADAIDALRAAASVGVELPLQLQCADDCLLHDGVPLPGPSLQARSLLRCCRERDVAMLTFGARLDAPELNRMFDLLLVPQNVGAFARPNREAVLSAFGIRNVQVTLRSPGDPGDRRCELDSARKALHQYQDLADVLQQNHARALHDQELGVAATADVVERTVTDLAEPSLLLALATQDDVDRFTVGHSVRVALLALQVAQAIGAPREQLVRVGSAALLHDIGKSKVPQEVLFKQGRLSPEEWHWMKQHPRLGAQILLEQHEHVDPRAIGAAFCHHLRPDGGGYPDALVPIPPGGTSRLVRVCDVFEALTSIRPYKRALTPIEAFAVMFRREHEFDPRWLRLFARTIGLFPNGTRVRLGDGATAVVREQTTCPERPVVQLLTGPDDSVLSPGQPDRFAVGECVDGRTVRIAAVDTHDRCVLVPGPDPEEVGGPSVAGGCLDDPHPV